MASGFYGFLAEKSHSYGGEEIRSQIQAVYDAGYEEWILWSASNKYHYGALESEESRELKDGGRYDGQNPKTGENFTAF